MLGPKVQSSEFRFSLLSIDERLRFRHQIQKPSGHNKALGGVCSLCGLQLRIEYGSDSDFIFVAV